MLLIDCDSAKYAAAQKCLDAAHDYQQLCAKEGEESPVRWIEDTEGGLLIFSRGEYRQTLLKNIEHRFGPTFFAQPEPTHKTEADELRSALAGLINASATVANILDANKLDTAAGWLLPQINKARKVLDRYGKAGE
jgi:hypothetical protein